MIFDITFHGPFRVATGTPLDGLDDSADPVNPLPASSLKGLMRAHAQHLLCLTDDLVNEVFGSSRHPSPWSWMDAQLNIVAPRIRTRVAITAETHTATENALFTASEMWPATGKFRVERRGAIPTDRIGLHETILAGSARAIAALGSDRRRGLGWVGITSERPWTEADTAVLRENRRLDA